MRVHTHTTHICSLNQLQLLMRARDSGKVAMSRMGLRQFPPEILSATNMCWDYGEVRGIFMTGRGRLDAIEEVWVYECVCKCERACDYVYMYADACMYIL